MECIQIVKFNTCKGDNMCNSNVKMDVINFWEIQKQNIIKTDKCWVQLPQSFANVCVGWKINVKYNKMQ